MAPDMLMLWIKALHVLAVISWMAGLLYLPRLMVYHTQTLVSSSEDERFKVMERRLLRAIMTPAAVVTVASGLVLAWMGGHLQSLAEVNWFSVKVLAVAGLLAVHWWLARHVKGLAAGVRVHSERYFRILNEVPTALMIVIVVMVIVRPF